jgi:hypothetical protein
MLQLPVGDRRESPSFSLSGLQKLERGDAEKEVPENIQDYNSKDILLKPRHTRCVLRDGAPRQQRETSVASDMPSGNGRSSHNGTEGPCALTPKRTTCKGAVDWGSKCKQPLENSVLRILAVVQQFMTEFNGAVSEEEKQNDHSN